MQMVHRRGFGSNNAEHANDAVAEDTKKRMDPGRASRLGGAFFCVLLFLGMTSSHKRKSDPAVLAQGLTNVKEMQPASLVKTDAKDPVVNFNLDKFSQAIIQYDNCQVSYVPPPATKEWTTKPLWLTAFPGSGSTAPNGKGDLIKPLVNSLTGLKAGAKFYHASSKGLRRCKGVDETATCSQGHPVVEVGPEQQANNFYSKVILVMRNIKTAFPQQHNDKAEAYHGITGQVSADSWRTARDTWYENVWNEWKKLIMTWKAMKEYDVALYIQYEALMDPERGPVITQKLADLLKEAGFSVAPPADIPCLWYRSVRDEYERSKQFWDYAPGYTEEQRDFFLQEFQTFQTEVAIDEPLVKILKEYHDDIRDNTRLDVSAPKQD